MDNGYDFNYLNHHKALYLNQANNLMSYIPNWGAFVSYIYGYDLYTRQFIMNNYYKMSIKLS